MIKIYVLPTTFYQYFPKCTDPLLRLGLSIPVYFLLKILFLFIYLHFEYINDSLKFNLKEILPSMILIKPYIVVSFWKV